MAVDWMRQYCLSLPHATESVQWGDHLVFKIGGRMFAVVSLSPAENFMSFKASPEDFAELTERPGVIPAPYLARSSWVALETEHAIPAKELKGLVRKAYDLVIAKLPRKTQATLAATKN